MGLIAEGSDIQSLVTQEVLYQEGDRGEVRLYLNTEMSESAVTQITSDLMAKGVVLTGPIIAESRILSIRFEKRIAPLVIIVAALLGSGVIGWQLFKPKWGAPLGIPVWVWATGAGLLVYVLYVGAKR